MSRYNIVSTVFLVLFIVSIAVDGTYPIPLWWYILIVAVYILINSYGAVVLSSSYFVKVRDRGNGNEIALTFDDGPVPVKTEKVLDILDQYNVRASFFCIGHRVQEHPDLASRIHQRGHLIGNHTYWHGALFDLKSSSMMTKEMADTDLALQKIIGKRPRLFRPPYGVSNPMLAKAIKRRNYVVIGWSVRSFDTVIRNEEKLFKRVTGALKGGDIILFHDYSDSMLAILPRVLDHIKKSGLKVVRVDELLKEKAYA